MIALCQGNTSRQERAAAEKTAALLAEADTYAIDEKASALPHRVVVTRPGHSSLSISLQLLSGSAQRRGNRGLPLVTYDARSRAKKHFIVIAKVDAIA